MHICQESLQLFLASKITESQSKKATVNGKAFFKLLPTLKAELLHHSKWLLNTFVNTATTNTTALQQIYNKYNSAKIVHI